MKIWLVAILLFTLSGCANTTWQELSDCRTLNPDEEGICAAEWAAYNKHIAAMDRREANRIANQCPKGMGRLTVGPFSDGGGCVSDETLRQVLRSYGY